MMFLTYSVLPHTGGSCEETSRRIPLDVSHTVVVCGGQKLEVGSEVLVLLILVALKVEVVEVEIVRLLAENGGDNDETTGG
jgi:hypothetical protein